MWSSNLISVEIWYGWTVLLHRGKNLTLSGLDLTDNRELITSDNRGPLHKVLDLRSPQAGSKVIHNDRLKPYLSTLDLWNLDLNSLWTLSPGINHYLFLFSCTVDQLTLEWWPLCSLFDEIRMGLRIPATTGPTDCPCSACWDMIGDSFGTGCLQSPMALAVSLLSCSGTRYGPIMNIYSVIMEVWHLHLKMDSVWQSRMGHAQK